jgi:hypothetical protein
MISSLLGATLLLVIYTAWIAGPYLRSIVVRDAAVTAWTHVMTAPIDGTITFEPLVIGSRIGASGLIAKIQNSHVSREPIDLAQLRLNIANAKKREAAQLLAEIEELEDDRRATKSDYADIFRSQLETKISHYRRMIEHNEKRLIAMRTIAERKQMLASAGHGSVNDADETSLRLTEAEIALDAMRGELSFLLLRKSGAQHGLFIEEGGDNPGWALADRMPLKIEKRRVRESLRALEVEVLAAMEALNQARVDDRRQTEALIDAPARAILWRRMAVSGMSVTEGTPVAEWVDCSEILVDMPLSDAEAGLLEVGDQADVILEGESEQRSAEVLLIRGSGSQLDHKELAALAKGRTEDLAHVILTLETVDKDRTTCPIGRAAHVDLKGVGLLDIVLARLRF